MKAFPFATGIELIECKEVNLLLWMNAAVEVQSFDLQGSFQDTTSHCLTVFPGFSGLSLKELFFHQPCSILNMRF